MSAFTAPKRNKTVTITPRDGALFEYMQEAGRLPPVTLSIFPLEALATQAAVDVEVFIDKFISYQFSSSILIPVDSFSCEFFWGARIPFKEGDLIVMRANGQALFSGIIDMVEIETDATQGNKVSVTGRDLLGQWEDQDSVNAFTDPIYGKSFTVDQVITALSKDTRIDPSKIDHRTSPKLPYLFATQPGETKLSSMQRFCEALDIYFWMSGDGRIIVGKPQMYGQSKGSFFMRGISALQDERASNCLTMRATFNATQIPNIIVPIWNGQENVQAKTAVQQHMYNNAPGPRRLRKLGHLVPKAVIISTPDGAAPQDLAEINTITVANQSAELLKITQAGASTLLQAYAKREMARANIKDLGVQVQTMGHYNDRAEALTIDQVYRIKHDSASVDEDMYLYQVEYKMDEKTSQMTNLMFCRQTALVSNVRAR